MHVHHFENWNIGGLIYRWHFMLHERRVVFYLLYDFLFPTKLDKVTLCWPVLLSFAAIR